MNAVVGTAALASGEIDYYTVLAPAVAAAIRELPIKIVACYMPSTPHCADCQAWIQIGSRG